MAVGITGNKTQAVHNKHEKKGNKKGIPRDPFLFISDRQCWRVGTGVLLTCASHTEGAKIAAEFTSQ